MSDEGKDQRIGFKDDVKKTIWRRAGGLCSIKGCLRSVFGSDGNLDSDGAAHRATSIGDAAHIYSARKKWARGHGGKTTQFIGSAANGISTCRSCHGNIDSVESRYSAEALLEMKSVREQAQDITRHNPAVAFYVSRIGTEHLDHLLWNAPDRTDEQSVAESFIVYAETAVQMLRSLKNRLANELPSPDRFERRPIVTAIHRANEPQRAVLDPATLRPIQRLRLSHSDQKESDRLARTIELVESWTCGRENVYVRDTVRCEFFTRDPITGAAGEPVIFSVLADALKGEDQQRRPQARLQIRGFEEYSVGFEWKVQAVADKGNHVFSSTLQLASLACPDSTEDAHEFQTFAGYARLLREISSGREPCARISKHNSMSRFEAQIHHAVDHFHPLEFGMKLLESSEKIDEVVAFNEKALLGYSLSSELRAPIIYRRSAGTTIPGPDSRNAWMQGFFDPLLTEELVREAIHEVRGKAHVDGRGRFGAISEPLVLTQAAGRPRAIRAYHDGHYTGFRLEADSRSATDRDIQPS